MLDRSLVQKAAVASGVVFLAITLAGFVPGLTQDFDRLTTFGDVGARLLGVFGVNWLENLVHLAYGIVGLVAARSPRAARAYFLLGGAAYLVIGVAGFAIDLDSGANVLGVNTAGNVLHVLLGLGMAAVGLVLTTDTTSEPVARGS